MASGHTTAVNFNDHIGSPIYYVYKNFYHQSIVHTNKIAVLILF